VLTSEVYIHESGIIAELVWYLDGHNLFSPNHEIRITHVLKGAPYFFNETRGGEKPFISGFHNQININN